MSWKVADRLDRDVVDSLVQKFQAIAEDPDARYSHQELSAAAQQFLGWVVLNIDCGGCRKNTKAAIAAGLKILFRSADEQAPPKPHVGSDAGALH
jgi:hypothetical protein